MTYVTGFSILMWSLVRRLLIAGLIAMRVLLDIMGLFLTMLSRGE